MNINMLNKHAIEVYQGNDNSYSLLLVDIDNIITSSAQKIHLNVEDKILYEVEDIKQEIALKIWLNLKAEEKIFVNNKDVLTYVDKIAIEVLNDIRG